MTPDRTREPPDDLGGFRGKDDGIDEAAGGADSPPFETEPSGDKAAKADDPPNERPDSSP